MRQLVPYIYAPITIRRFHSGQELEALPDPPSTDKILGDDLTMTGEITTKISHLWR